MAKKASLKQRAKKPTERIVGPANSHEILFGFAPPVSSLRRGVSSNGLVTTRADLTTG